MTDSSHADAASVQHDARRAAAALRDNEERLRLLFNSMSEAFTVQEAILDAAGQAMDFRYLEANPAFTAQTGLAQPLGRTMHELMPAMEPVWQEQFRAVLATGAPARFETFVSALGRWLRVSVSRLGGPGSLRLAILSMDISESKQAEAALRLGEMRFRTLTDAVPQVIWTNRADGRADYFNQRWFDYSGLSVEDSDGIGWRAGLHPDDLDATLARWTHAVTAGEEFVTEYRLRRADGAFRWHLARAVPLRDDAGGVLGWFGTATDIHDLKEAEATITATEERLRLIVESALEHAIVSLDLQTRVTSWNPGAERIFGYTAEEMMGRTLDLICTPEDRAEGFPNKEAAQALAEGRSGGERWHPRRDGSLFWTSCVMMPMTARPGGAPIGFVKILRDETQALEARRAVEQSRLFLEDALRDAEAARAEAEAASRSKDHFLAVLSHELRTPLTPVLMGVHMLNRNRDLTDFARETLGMITRNVQLEVSLIDDLLDLTRVGRGKLELAREECDLHHIIHRAVEVVSSDLAGKAQRLTVALDAPVHRLTGDCTRLQQVCWNLLKNASKFTPEGGAITIRSRAGKREDCVEVEVSDTGIGMDAGVVERIFHPFEQADLSITKQFGGLGLGLAISKAVVAGHGGELRAASPGRGRGATLTVSLPLDNR